MTRYLLLLSITFLTACVQMEEEVMEEPMVMAEEVTDCLTGDDDGIGGTGCAVDQGIQATRQSHPLGWIDSN